MRRLPTPLLRPAYRVGYVLLMAFSRIVRPHTRGVKCVIASGERILLVRHSYGPARWDLPGGFCRRGEEFGCAARREVEEELGIRDASWTELGELRRRHYGRHETLHAFRADVDAPRLTIERAEVAEVRWFPRDDLPDGRADIVHAVLALERS